MNLTVTHADLRQAVQLIAAHLTDDDEWWNRSARVLLSRITGDEVVCGCERCCGRGYIYKDYREVVHRDCNGNGYHTPETLARKCAYCCETDPDQLTLDDGIWVCDDEQCGIDHVNALRGQDADRRCSERAVR